jgi:fatty acid desaturase
MSTETALETRKEPTMSEDIRLVLCVALVWAALAIAYAVAPWGDMIGYAWVWGFGAVLFVGLGLLLWRASRDRPPSHPPS